MHLILEEKIQHTTIKLNECSSLCVPLLPNLVTERYTTTAKKVVYEYTTIRERGKRKERDYIIHTQDTAQLLHVISSRKLKIWKKEEERRREVEEDGAEEQTRREDVISLGTRRE